MELQFLDCTLRDGGYYNNWDFDNEFVKNYFENIKKLPFNYVEIGYQNNKNESYKGKYFYCKEYLTKKIKQQYAIKIAVMLDAKLFDKESINNFSVDSNVDLYRIACNPDKIEDSIKLIETIKNQNKKVALNFMYANYWMNNEKIINQIVNISSKIDYIYVVDSYGSLLPNEVSFLIEKLTKTGAAVGFHPHNNLELAFANTLEAIKSGVKIIDSTFLGMGRGAGNLKSELILPYIFKEKLNYSSLSALVNQLEILEKDYNWGINLPYIFSGLNGIPQSDVMSLLNNHLFTFDQIISSFDKSTFLNYNLFPDNKNIRNALIIGGGASTLNCLEELKLFSEKNKFDLIFTSSKYLKYFQKFKTNKYLCITGREYERYQNTIIENNLIEEDFCLIVHDTKINYFGKKHKSKLAYLIEDKLFDNQFIFSTTSLALNLAKKLKGNTFLVGYDGHSENKNHHLENESIFNTFSLIEDRLVSLTKTSYNSLDVNSIYSQL